MVIEVQTIMRLHWLRGSPYLGVLNCDLLSETISTTKHLVEIYNTYGLKKVIKEATRTTAETNTLIDHIVTNKKDNIADSGIIPCGLTDHDLVYIIRHARIPALVVCQIRAAVIYNHLRSCLCSLCFQSTSKHV